MFIRQLEKPRWRINHDQDGLTYTGIRVRDMDLSIDFYTEVFGTKLIHRRGMRATGGEYALLKSKGSAQRLELTDIPLTSRGAAVRALCEVSIDCG